MPQFDFGEEGREVRPTSVGGGLIFFLRWSDQGRRRSVLLLAKAVLEVGRRSDCDICLRIEPSSEPDNREKTFRISSNQFAVRYLGDCVEVIDRGSTNGTFVASSKRLEPNVPWKVEVGQQISAAQVLDLALEIIPRASIPSDTDAVITQAHDRANDPRWLQEHLVGDDKPGKIAFLKARRLNNLTDTEYAVLFHSAPIGSGEGSILRIEPSTGSSRRIRAFDFGDAISEDPARLMVRNGTLMIERTGSEEISVDGKSLQPKTPVALQDGMTIIISGTAFCVENKE
jgi:pSer/pThr/pTyr-binding forkhead associated (FHA) protein